MNRERLKAAIVELNKEGIYPSAKVINKKCLRQTDSLNGKECGWRREIFTELGITLKRTDWNKSQRHDWWNE